MIPNVFDNEDLMERFGEEGYSQATLDDIEKEGYTHIMFGGDEEEHVLHPDWSPGDAFGIESLGDGT